jgi:hypothetical protein
MIEFPGKGRRPFGESWHYVAGHEPQDIRLQVLEERLRRLEKVVYALAAVVDTQRREARHAGIVAQEPHR